MSGIAFEWSVCLSCFSAQISSCYIFRASEFTAVGKLAAQLTVAKIKSEVDKSLALKTNRKISSSRKVYGLAKWRSMSLVSFCKWERNVILNESKERVMIKLLYTCFNAFKYFCFALCNYWEIWKEIKQGSSLDLCVHP